MAEEVELVSSGYAWRCPECMRTEYENAVPATGTVRCSRCGASFAVKRISHRAEPALLGGEQPALEAPTPVAQPCTDEPVPWPPRPSIAPTP